MRQQFAAPKLRDPPVRASSRSLPTAVSSLRVYRASTSFPIASLLLFLSPIEICLAPMLRSLGGPMHSSVHAPTKPNPLRNLMGPQPACKGPSKEKKTQPKTTTSTSASHDWPIARAGTKNLTGSSRGKPKYHVSTLSPGRGTGLIGLNARTHGTHPRRQAQIKSEPETRRADSVLRLLVTPQSMAWAVIDHTLTALGQKLSAWMTAL